MKKFRPKELENYKFSTSKIKPLTKTLSFRLGKTAHYWGMMPWEFRSLPPYRQAELCALHDVDRLIEAYYNDQQIKKMDRESPNKRSGQMSKRPKSSRYSLR